MGFPSGVLVSFVVYALWQAQIKKAPGSAAPHTYQKSYLGSGIAPNSRLGAMVLARAARAGGAPAAAP
jgi:hypothetical protein